MLRREFLKGLGSLAILMRAARGAEDPLAAFRHIVTSGAEALGTWRELRAAREEWPVIIGGDESFAEFAELGISDFDTRSVEEILAIAAKVRHPEDVAAWQNAQYGGDRVLPPTGTWPSAPQRLAGPSLLRDLDGRLLDRVHILVVPAADGAEVFARFRWGGWNVNPPAEMHVAAMRSWSERYGAELVGISADTLDIRVARRPATRAEAMALAEEHFAYCEDVVLQGTGDMATLAAYLLDSDWWFFWWD